MNTTLDSEQTALHRSVVATPFDATPRMVLADWWQENDREDVAAMWRGQIPRIGTRDRIDAMTEAERSRMAAWAQRWIDIGLSTEPADRPMFEAAVTQCYLAASLNPPRMVWCPNPLVAVTAGAIYTRWAQRDAVDGAVREAVSEAVRGAVREAVREAVSEAVHGAVHGAVSEAVHGAVRGAVSEAVHGAVGEAVYGAVGGAVDEAVREAVSEAVHGAVRDTVHGAVHGAVYGAVGEAVSGAVRDTVHGAVHGAVRDTVHGAVHGAVRDAVDGTVDGAVDEAIDEAVSGAIDGAVREAVGEAVGDLWCRYFGGQFWVGGYYWGSPSYVSFFLDVLRLRLPEPIELAARAYAATASSACWWWPHREVVFVSERPHTIQVRKNKPPTVQWEGWGIGQVQDTNQTLAR